MVKENAKGVGLCVLLALVGQWLGQLFPLVGGPVFSLLIGMSLYPYFSSKNAFQSGLTFTSKKILQYAVICLGFGLNLSTVMAVGRQSLPIILSTISFALFLAFLMWKWLPISSHLATLIGVGTSICGGSAIAATAPIIKADDEDVAQAISVIFLLRPWCFRLWQPGLGFRPIRVRPLECSQEQRSMIPRRSPQQQPPGTAFTDWVVRPWI